MDTAYSFFPTDMGMQLDGLPPTQVLNDAQASNVFAGGNGAVFMGVCGHLDVVAPYDLTHI